MYKAGISNKEIILVPRGKVFIAIDAILQTNSRASPQKEISEFCSRTLQED